MAIYEFRCDACGRSEQKSGSMRKPVGIGKRHSDPCKACGGAIRRVLSIPTLNSEYQAARNKYPYSTVRYAHLKGCEERDAAGHLVIESAKHEREVAAMNGLCRE